jgi:uncharacterized protein (TIGR02444 family)
MHTDNTVWPSSEQFWQWSLRVYPHLQPQLLQWQDEFGANVNVLLLLWYLERLPLELNSADIVALQHAIAAQQQLFTLPLRQLRRQLPAHLDASAAAAFKQQLLQTELASEQLEQQQLIACLQRLPLRPKTTQQHLPTLYLQQLEVQIDALSPQIVDLDQAIVALQV